jgi:hypothetical protein
MSKYGITPFSYPFILKYRDMPVDYQFDEQLTMYYVLHKDKRLYFPQQFSQKKIIKSYRWLMTEQDIYSPHRYITDISQLKDKILLDCGAAEGMLTLDFIEIIKQAYLFECDKEWIKALNATFAPYKDKITIIDKYVSDTNEENNITIDKFLEDKEKNNLFLKMDIEGFEQMALRGASKTLEDSKDLDFAICTYHKKNDAIEIAAILNSYGFDYEYTQGYFYVNWDEGKKGFRKAIIKRKQNTSTL